MDETWGLSWSRRWHKIYPPLSDGFKDARAQCGSYVYRQQEIRDARDLRHLKEILTEPEKAAGVCKKCEKQAAQTAPK